jgi:hypothetical protein
MQKAGIAGDFLPWRDVLHDGPVPDGLCLPQLSEVRAQFISDRGWGKAERIKQSFIERDRTLESIAQYEKVILWFEHDLYDQLQLLQILDWLSQNRAKISNLTLICVDQYLGTISPQEMAALVKYEEAVTDKHFTLAREAWAAFRSDTPENWLALFKSDTSALPFLSAAVIRLLEEYPACATGLSRTAHQALDIIHAGESRPGKVFGLYQQSEERRFMGDSSFWVILNDLLASSPPLLTLPEAKKLSLPISPEQALTITNAGEEVLNKQCNWLEMIEIDKWIGGVHLTSDNIWCWDSAAQTIEKQHLPN